MIRLNLSARLISHDTVFFSHNKSASSSLSAAKTISRIARMGVGVLLTVMATVVRLPCRSRRRGTVEVCW
jgi:hypothetical protein